MISSICWGVSYSYSKLADTKDNGGLGGLMETIDALFYLALGLLCFLIGFIWSFFYKYQLKYILWIWNFVLFVMYFIIVPLG